MADAIDAKEFVLRAKQLLSLAEYQDFVIALRTLRASCGNENEDTEMINNLMYQVSKVFSAPDRRDLLRNFVAFVPPAHQATYIELANLEMRDDTEVTFDRQPGIHLVKRPIEVPVGAPKAEVASSMAGQKLSHKPTQPSYSFGTCPRNRHHKQLYKEFATGETVMNMEDMPGGRGSEATPSAGTFDINDSTVGHKEKNAPTFRFGTEMQRNNKVYISKYHSQIDKDGGDSRTYPGPGTHEAQPAIGFQPLSERETGPSFSFKRGADTGRNNPIRPEPERTPGSVSKRKMNQRRSNDILQETIRNRRMYVAPAPQLPVPEDQEMQVATDSALVHPQAPQFSIPRNPRVPAFFKHQKQPHFEYQTALMKCTQSPGPKYYPDPNKLDSKKSSASQFSFGIAGTCGRHSYLPHKTQERKKNGLAGMAEHAHNEKKAIDGTEALQAIISSIGKQQEARRRNAPNMKFGNSKRLHFSDQKVFTAESDIRNRKCASVYAAKWK